MAQMGAGMAEVGANIGRTLQRGYESMGQGIAGGITAAADAYKQYKDTQSEIKASEKSYETMKSFLPEEVRNKFDQEIESLNNSDTTSLRDKAAFWNQAKSFIGRSVGQAFQMQKQQKEIDAAMAGRVFSEGAATGRTAAQIASQEGQPMRQAVAGYMFPEERQPSAPTSLFGPMQVPQQPTMYSPQPQNTFAVPKKFSIHSQRPEQR